MQIRIDFELWAYVVLALGVSLSINLIVLLKYVGKKYPHFLYKED